MTDKQLLIRRLALWLLWLGFSVYAFSFAPPEQPNTLELIQRLATAQVEGINPLIVALFNIMGVFPVIYACLLLFDGRMQPVRAYPFVLGSFAVGAFAILPYLALRQPSSEFTGHKNWFLKILESRWLGGSVAIAVMLLVAYGLTQGDWADFVQQWQTSRFIHVMSLDFCLLCLLFPIVLKDDMARRNWQNPSVFWLISLVPLVGSALYLLVRPAIAVGAVAPHPAVPASTEMNQTVNQ
ncbi:MAG: DUF2834 domain-containing protein [Leptolyngbyaceae cyanobacterium bins.349]|nr:DUF2834 domain-containing protein [Leptolyngbyaceae cyanobacterium bins.349]